MDIGQRTLKRAPLFLSVIVLIAVFCLIVLWMRRSGRPEYPLIKTIQYSYTLNNATGRVIKEAELWAHAPVRITSTQQCGTIEASQDYDLIRDDLGNQVLHFTVADLPPYGSRIIRIKAKVMLSHEANKFNVPDLKPFLMPEPHVESDHPEMRKAAGKFKTPNTLKRAEAAMGWTAEQVRYVGYVKNRRGALYALREKSGDCTEYMDLFTALCRAQKIPARGVGGYICKESVILKPAEYHNWSQFYHKGAWLIADPQNKVFMRHNQDYIAMRILGRAEEGKPTQFDRFRFKGEGLEVRMN